MPPPGKPDGQLSDSEFLARQADEAMKAMARTWAEMKGGLGAGANPVEWAKQYPWVTLGAGAVAGFVATALLVPSKEDQALRKLAKIERALNPEPRHREPPRTNGDRDERDRKQGGGLMYMLGRELIKAVQPAVVSLLTAGVTAKATKPSQEEMEAAAQSADMKQDAAGGGYDPQP